MKKMCLLSLVLLPLFAVIAVGGDEPQILALKVAPGESVTFELEENITTGFEWMVKYDRSLCQVTKIHRGPENTGEPVCGAPGKAVFTVKLLTDAPADLTLEYCRPWEKDTPPARTLYYAIVPQTNTAPLPPKR